MSEPLVTHFAEHAEYTGVMADDRPGWLALRRTMVTASDVAAILGEDVGPTGKIRRAALDVFVEKTVDQPDAPQPITSPAFWGVVVEQPVLSAVARYYGWPYMRGAALLRSRRHPHLGATLDAEVEATGAWRVFEGKTTQIPRGWNEKAKQLPTTVLIQVQTQLLVTQAPSAIVFALLQGCRPVRIEIEPSPALHQIIVEHTEAFLDRVRRFDAPLPQQGCSAAKALGRLYPSGDGSVINLPAEAVEWTRERMAIAAEMRRLESRKTYLADRVRHAMGSCSWGVLPEPVGGKRAWSWQGEARRRKLVATKLPPGMAARALPAREGDPLVEQLAASVEANTNVTRIRFGTKRRRASR